MKKNKSTIYPVLPLRDIVIFPNMIVPIFVGRKSSIAALDASVENHDKKIMLILQKNQEIEDPAQKDLCTVGVLGTLLQLLRLPDGTIKLLVQGEERMHIDDIDSSKECMYASVSAFVEKLQYDENLEALIHTCLAEFEEFTRNNRKIPSEILEGITKMDDPSKLADTIASYFTLKLEEKQALLEIEDVNLRLNKVLQYIESESTIVDIEKKIRSRVKQQIEKTQRDYYLNEQLKAINKELSDAAEGRDDIQELEDKRKKIKAPKEVNNKIDAEIKKLKLMHASSAEAAIVRNYVDWLISVPWNNPKKIQKNLHKAEEVLNCDHYGLDKIKERILEYLAVQSRMGKVKSQILCLVGPPGVGKTSLGQSIAKATGRTFVRMSLGGVRDESEIRGHRRTYMGSMPGKIIQGMKKAKTSNPLFLLDEIDKMSNDWRGDPASALLEVLDPEQNSAFNDHYLEVDYDLSDVMFITTANSLDMPQPLLDRMEVIRLTGYTEIEKIEIIKQHLFEKQKSAHGLAENELTVDLNVWPYIIRHYTKEAGVRNLEREIAKIARKSVRIIESSERKHIHVTLQNIEEFLSVPKFDYELIEVEDQIGATTGLAWTEFGGDILSIEVGIAPGKGNVKITGKLGDVMQESAQAAFSYVKAQAHKFGLKASVFERHDIHIHVPAGATPKDGPSAGIALCTSLVSALTGIAVRKDVAMTGEITLRGKVLPIGGLKEKLLAAQRAGIKTVVIPADNTKDLIELPDEVKGMVDIIPVKNASEVLKIALVSNPDTISLIESNDLDRLKNMELMRSSTIPNMHEENMSVM